MVLYSWHGYVKGSFTEYLFEIQTLSQKVILSDQIFKGQKNGR